MSAAKDPRRVTAANLAAWNEAAPIHARHNQAALIEAFRAPGHSVFDADETAWFAALGVKGKDVAQVCCNNGRELLSVKNMGAARCVGFDGAQGFIAQARELAAAAGLDAEFVCGDIYDIDRQYARNFDLVFITIGVISWMPDLERFFAAVAGLIRPGDALFIYEQHPILDMFKPGPADAPVEWELSYFNKEPYVETDGLDYYGNETYDARPVTSFQYTMSDIITACLTAGLTLERFEELPDHISNTWWNVEAAGLGLPMSYTLTMRKGS